MEAYLYQSTGKMHPNVTNKLDISESSDLHLVIGKKRYRLDVLPDGSLRFVLINGNECKIDAWHSYPCVILGCEGYEYNAD